MAAPSKSVGNTLLSLQSVSSNTVVISSALDVSTKFAAWITIHFGRRATTALTEGVEFRIEGSSKSSGDGHWHMLTGFKTMIAAAESEAVSGTVNSGTNVITVASTTNLTGADLIYIDNSTIGNSEWGNIKSISTNTSVTIEDNLVNAQTGSTLYDQAEMFNALIDLSAVTRLRLVADAYNTGQAVAVEAFINYLNSIA